MSHEKKFIGGIGLLLVLNALVKPIWVLVVDNTVQLNNLNTSDYAQYIGLMSMALSLYIVSDAGITNWYTTTVAARQQKVLFTEGILSLKLLLSGFYFLFILLMAWLLGYDVFIAIGVGLINLISGFTLLYRAHLTAQQKFSKDALLSITDKLIATVVLVILVYSNLTQLSIWAFMFCQIIGLLIVLVLCFFIAPISFKYFTWHTALLAKTWPYAVVVLLMAFIYRSSIFFISLKHNGNVLVSNFNLGFRLIDVLNSVLFFVMSYFIPYYAHNSANNYLNKKKRKIIWLLIALLAVGNLVYYISIPWWQPLLYQGVQQSIYSLQWSAIMIVPLILFHISTSLLTATQLVRPSILPLLIISLLCAVFYLILHTTAGYKWYFVLQSAAMLLVSIWCFVIYFTKSGKSKSFLPS
jgi:O-antigen/teichoic acid export membrane protein